jgi:hypothetical protein
MLLKGGISQIVDLIEGCVLGNQAAIRQKRLIGPGWLMILTTLSGPRTF